MGSSMVADDLQLVVRAEELAEFEDDRVAKRLERLEADQELTIQLSIEGFEGNAWRLLSVALAEYGYAVIGAWISTGLILRKCHDRGISLPVFEQSPTADDILYLTQDVVADALLAFRDRVLATATWNPQKGASLATYFIGMCLIKFPNTRRAWNRQQKRWGSPEPLDPELPSKRTAPSAEETVVSAVADSDAVKAILSLVPTDENQAIIRLRSEGYGVDEIAEITGLTYKQVESRLSRVRSSLRKRLRSVTEPR